MYYARRGLFDYAPIIMLRGHTSITSSNFFIFGPPTPLVIVPFTQPISTFVTFWTSPCLTLSADVIRKSMAPKTNTEADIDYVQDDPCGSKTAFVGIRIPSQHA